MVRTSFNRETRKAYLSKIMSQLATTIHRTSCYHLLHALWANENRQYSEQAWSSPKQTHGSYCQSPQKHERPLVTEDTRWTPRDWKIELHASANYVQT